MLDLNSDLAKPDFEEILPVAPIGAENHFRVGIDLKFAAIGHLKNAPAIRAGDYDFQWLNRVSGIESPRVVAAHDRKLSRKLEQSSGAIGVRQWRLRAQTRAHGEKQRGKLSSVTQRWP